MNKSNTTPNSVIVSTLTMTTKHVLNGALRSSRQLATRAAPPALRGFATAASRTATRPQLHSQAARPVAAHLPPCPGRGLRWSTDSATGSKTYDFEEVRKGETRATTVPHPLPPV